MSLDASVVRRAITQDRIRHIPGLSIFQTEGLRVRATPSPRRQGSRLVVPIKPIWGDQKVLRYYRQALVSLQPHDAAEIAKFRAANAAIEARLRRKLPQRMEEIDFLYGGLRGLPEAGRGHPRD